MYYFCVVHNYLFYLNYQLSSLNFLSFLCLFILTGFSWFWLPCCCIYTYNPDRSARRLPRSSFYFHELKDCKSEKKYIGQYQISLSSEVPEIIRTHSYIGKISYDKVRDFVVFFLEKNNKQTSYTFCCWVVTFLGWKSFTFAKNHLFVGSGTGSKLEGQVF